MKMLLAVPALALLAAPAFARPDVPYKAEIRMHVQADGRADLHYAASSRRDAYERTVTSVTGSSHDNFGRASKFSLPLKADVAHKLQNAGANPEGAANKPEAGRITRGVSTDNNPYAHLRPSKFSLPLKTQIAMKLHSGDNRESSVTGGASAAKPADRFSKEQSHKPLSKGQKTALCQQTGVCLPFLAGSDDVADKTE